MFEGLSHYSRYLIAGAELLLLVFLLWWLSLIITPLPKVPVAPVVKTSSVSQQVNKKLNSVARWNLFGMRQHAEPVQQSTQRAPETRLKLTLKGTLVREDANKSLAFVADARGQQESYLVGESVPGGAKITRIEPGYILIRRGAREERLTLEEEKLQANQQTVQNQRAVKTPAQRKSFIPAQSYTMKGGGSTHISPGLDLSAVRERLRQDPVKIAQQVSATPVSENGKLIGYRLRPGREGQLLKQLGVQSQDVITEVNGRALNNPAELFAVLKDLQTGTNFRVTLIRNGQPMNLNVDLRSP